MKTLEQELGELLDIYCQHRYMYEESGVEYEEMEKAKQQFLALIKDIDRQAREKGIKQFIEWGWGKRCEVKDTDEFPEILDEPTKNTRCLCCEMWEHYDEYIDRLSSIKGEK